MDASAYFAGKKITVMGLGLLGRGVGDTEYLAACGADLLVTDQKTKEELAPSLARLAVFPSIRFALGGHNVRDFRNRDLILKGAGVPYDSPYLKEAHERGIPVRMSTELFLELSGIPSIGVTGTRGKTTTTSLIADIMELAGMRVLRGGNLQGISTLGLLPTTTSEHYAVLELDSWQLQGFGDAGRSPDIAVFTSWYQDHQYYYRNRPERYFRDKAQICIHQGSNGIAIIASQAYAQVAAHLPQIASRAQVPDAHEFSSWETRLLGMHNLHNIACAVTAVRALGIPDEVSRRAVAAFAPVPGRLELVGERKGVRIYNDAAAIIPEATVAALEALRGTPTILIMGGGDKHADTAELVAAAQARAKHVVLLAGTGTDTIRDAFPGALVHTQLGSALADAFAHATQGDAVLFSPAFSSKGLFADAYERSDQFAASVQRYG